MRYFPLNLDIRGKKVIVIGGGNVAARKCAALLDAAAQVTVVAPRLSPALRELAENGVILHLERGYCEGDLAGSVLVFAATEDNTVNRLVAEESHKRGIPANIADDPGSCSFTVPASITRGDLLITISTSGKCPAFAGKLRHEMAQRYGEEYAPTLLLLGRLREKLLTQNSSSAYNKEILNDFIDHDLPALIKYRRFPEIDNLLQRLFGSGLTLAALGLGEKDLT